MATFPAIRPMRRSLTFGEYPVKAYRALSGKVVRRSFGSRPYGAVLDLSFEGIDDIQLRDLFDHYNRQQGVTIGFDLPDEVFAGLSENMTARMRFLAIDVPVSPFIEWLYAESPTVETIFTGRSRVTIKLVGEFI